MTIDDNDLYSVSPRHGRDYTQDLNVNTMDSQPLDSGGNPIDDFWRHVEGFRAGFQAEMDFSNLFRPSFRDDENFNPYVESLKRGDELSIDILETAKSLEEYNYLSNHLKSNAYRNKLIARYPTSATIGAFTPWILGSPSSALTLRGSTSVKNILKYAGVVTAATAAEELVVYAMKPEYTKEQVSLSVATAGVATMGIGMLMKAGNRLPKAAKDYEELAEDYATQTDRIDAMRGEPSGHNVDVDPYSPEAAAQRDPYGAEGRGVGAGGPEGAEDLSPEARIWATRMYNAGFMDKASDIVTPLSRLMGNKTIPEVSELMENLVDIPWLMNKNTNKEASVMGVSNDLRTRWTPTHGSWRQTLDREYLQYLKEQGQSPVGSVLLSDVRNRIGGSQVDYATFRRMVWEDMARGLEDTDFYKASPAVRRAAQKSRQMYDDIIDEVMEQRLHVRDLEERLKATDDPAKRNDIVAEINARTDGIKRNKKSFVNVVFDKEHIRKNRTRFRDFIIMKKRLPLEEAEAKVDEMLKEQIYVNVSDDIDEVGTARSLRGREFVDDPLEWREWIDDDIMNTGTLYFRTMTPDIELARRFGNVNLRDQLMEIEKLYSKKIGEAPKESRADLAKERDRVLEDLRAVRDLIRGTYMLPPDAEHVSSRAIRIAKNWSAATALTGALAAIPDVARVVTANGLHKSFGSLYEGLIKNRKLYKMAKSEAQSVGEAWDMVLGTRAAVFADLGEAAGAWSKAERISAEIGQQSFNLNLMNFWNETMKSASTLVISTKILQDVEAVMKGNPTEKISARLAANGIDEEMARRIFAEQERWTRTDHNILAQAATWADQEAADAFRAALSRELNIVVLTPGVAERPLWMSQTLDKTLGVSDAPAWLSQPYLSLVGQFKSFMISSTYRTLIPAIQQRDRDTAAMIAIAVGMGILIDQIRAEQGGYPGPRDPFDAILSGIDRSGVLGWYLEPNNVMERMSGNSLGLRAIFSDPPQFSPSNRTLMSTFLGPSGGVAANMMSLIGDVMDGEFDHYTAKAIRRALPWQNVAHFDFVFDALQDGLKGAGYEVRDYLRGVQTAPVADAEVTTPYQ